MVGNQYGSNLGLVPDDYDLGQFFEDTGLTAHQLFDANAYIESAPEVDHWQKKFVHGQSLCNPEALRRLGTQMFALHEWYMQACGAGDLYLGVRVREEHWFRGDDIMYIDFAEFHQLCHLNSLDKTLISCYCL